MDFCNYMRCLGGDHDAYREVGVWRSAACAIRIPIFPTASATVLVVTCVCGKGGRGPCSYLGLTLPEEVGAGADGAALVRLLQQLGRVPGGFVHQGLSRLGRQDVAALRESNALSGVAFVQSMSRFVS